MSSHFHKLIATSLKALLVIGLCFHSVFALAYDPNKIDVNAAETPKDLKDIEVSQNLGSQIDLSLEFQSDEGEQVTLGKYFDNNRPVLMTMVYYNCPGLCNYHLNGLIDTFKKMKWTAGKDFRVLAVSMDHRENAEVAGPKKANYIEEYGRPEGQTGWHFLTGSKENVKKIADQLGFKFKWVESQGQYAHAAATYVITPGGQISRYIYGISFLPNTLKLALLEASNGKIGSLVEQVLLFCFQFDPKKNKYTLYAWNIMRLGALVTVILLALFLVPYWIREKKKAAAKGEG